MIDKNKGAKANPSKNQKMIKESAQLAVNNPINLGLKLYWTALSIIWVWSPLLNFITLSLKSINILNMDPKVIVIDKIEASLLKLEIKVIEKNYSILF